MKRKPLIEKDAKPIEKRKARNISSLNTISHSENNNLSKQSSITNNNILFNSFLSKGNSEDDNIQNEVKEARKQNQLLLVNKGVSQFSQNKENTSNIQNHRDHLNTLTFPLILKSTLGIYKNKLSIPQIKDLLNNSSSHSSSFDSKNKNNIIINKDEDEEFVLLEIFNKEYHLDECLDISLPDKGSIIGYISKEISILLLNSLKFEILQHYFILDKTTLEINIIISFNFLNEKVSLSTFNFLKEKDYDYNYQLKSSNLIPIETVKSLNNLSQSIRCIKLTDLDKKLKECLKTKIFINKISDNELDYDTDDGEDKQTSFNQFLLMNIENILSIANQYSFLFNLNELKCFDFYFKDLNEIDKDIISKFLTRSSVWINRKKLALTMNKIKNENDKLIVDTIEKLKAVGLIYEIESIFSKSNSNIYSKADLFTFLYHLTNDELRVISKDFSKLSKYNSKLEENEKVVDEILMNNSFYRLDKYMDFAIFKFLCEKTSKEISAYNFDNRNNTDTLNIKNKFLGGNKNKLSSTPNFKYISTYLNSTNYKKVKISKNNFSQKMNQIAAIIKNIDYFLNDKSSNVMDNFLMKNVSIKKPQFDKKEKIITILSQFDMYTLDTTFAKLFDCASRLFFFYTDYKDINDVAKEFYGFENFERFDNYVISSKDTTAQSLEVTNVLELKKTISHLQPIFTMLKEYKLYDNLYQIKTSFLINSMIFNHNNLNFYIVKIFSFYLMHLNNSRLFKNIYEEDFNDKLFDMNENGYNVEPDKLFDNTVIEDILTSIENQEPHEKLIQILLDANFHFVENQFLSKFKFGNLTAELLNYFAECCEKVKNYKLAALIFLFLLLNNFLYKKRGLWWYRLILIYNIYLKNKVICVKLLNKSSSDPYIKSGYLVKLKQYYERFEKEKNKVQSKKNNNNNNKNKNKNSTSKEHLNELETDGVNILTEKEVYDDKLFIDKKRIIQADSVYNKTTGRRLYSLGNRITTVEEFAIDFYKKLDYTGVHGENIILPALYNVFLWDVIFYDQVPFVFQSPYQIYPLDFFSEDFYNNRQFLIDERLNQISNFTTQDVENTFNYIYTKKKNIKCAFISWGNVLNDKEILSKIAIAITPKKLALIFFEFCKNLKFMIKGMPDLFLWKEEYYNEGNSRTSRAIEGSGLIVEVKSKNDKLSEYQKYWLSFLSRVEQNIEVLHIE